MTVTRDEGERGRWERRRWMRLALSVAVGVLALKGLAYAITGSVALLSDAAESLIHVVAALLALVAVEIAARPADESHPYGHEKAEYFSSGAEGTLILLAAGGIAYKAVERLLHPDPLEELPLGLGIAATAALVNLLLAWQLLRAARAHGSILLEAHAKHLLTDVWTTAGVLLGLGATLLTGFTWLDPALALAVALNIVVSGVDLLKRSFRGLMDTALPPHELQKIEAVLQKYSRDGPMPITYHRLRTRRAGPKRFVDFHLLVPGRRTVQETHDLCERIERDIREALGGPVSITIHVEPLEDEASWEEDAEAHTARRGPQPQAQAQAQAQAEGRRGR